MRGIQTSSGHGRVKTRIRRRRSASIVALALIGFASTLSATMLDVDRNGTIGPESDLVYVARSLLGLSPVPPSYRVTQPAIPDDAAIDERVTRAVPYLDVDLSGTVAVDTDVLFITRYLLGLAPVPNSYRSGVLLPPDPEVEASIAPLLVPGALVAPEPIDVGEIGSGASRDVNLLLENEGDGYLTVESVESSDPNTFAILAWPPAGVATPYAVIPPGESLAVGIRFGPVADGESRLFTATLEIVSDDPDSPVRNVPIEGDFNESATPFATATPTATPTITPTPTWTFTLTRTETRTPTVTPTPQPPVIGSLSPALGYQGRQTQVRIRGSFLANATNVSVDGEGVGVTILPGGTEFDLYVRLDIGLAAALGVRQLSVVTPFGATSANFEIRAKYVDLSPTNLGVPTRATGSLTVTLQEPAAEPGQTLVVSSSRPDRAAVPAEVVVPAGQTTTSIPITTDRIVGSANIGVTGEGFSARTVPVEVSRRTFIASVPQFGPGTTAKGKIDLASPAPAGGATFQLSIRVQDTNLVQLPQTTVVVPEGASSTTFDVVGLSVGTVDLTLDGTADGYETRTISFLVADRFLNVPAADVIGLNETLNVAVTLTPDGAPSGGITVNVAASDPNVLEVLTPTLSFSSGQTSRTATVRGRGVAGLVDLTVSHPSYAPDTMRLAVSGTLDSNDADGDGIPNDIEEQLYGTDPASVDSDEDGYPDNVEIDEGSDPTSADSIPVAVTTFAVAPAFTVTNRRGDKVGLASVVFSVSNRSLAAAAEQPGNEALLRYASGPAFSVANSGPGNSFATAWSFFSTDNRSSGTLRESYFPEFTVTNRGPANIEVAATTLTVDNGTLRIVLVDFDPPGSDVEGERVEILNAGAFAVDMTGWTLRDLSGTTFTFPSFVLGPQQSVNVWVKSGTATATDLYWGRGSEVWDATDRAVLRDASGNLRDVRAYP